MEGCDLCTYTTLCVLISNVILCCFDVSRCCDRTCWLHVRTCVLIRPPAIVAKHDNTHVFKASFPSRSDSDLDFHCKGAVAETFPERALGIIRVSSWSKVGIHEFITDVIETKMKYMRGIRVC